MIGFILFLGVVVSAVAIFGGGRQVKHWHREYDPTILVAAAAFSFFPILGLIVGCIALYFVVRTDKRHQQ